MWKRVLKKIRDVPLSQYFQKQQKSIMKTLHERYAAPFPLFRSPIAPLVCCGTDCAPSTLQPHPPAPLGAPLGVRFTLPESIIAEPVLSQRAVLLKLHSRNALTPTSPQTLDQRFHDKMDQMLLVRLQGHGIAQLLNKNKDQRGTEKADAVAQEAPPTKAIPSLAKPSKAKSSKKGVSCGVVSPGSFGGLLWVCRLGLL